MASLTSPRRPDTTDRHRYVVEASEAVRDEDRSDVDPVSWPVAAVVGGLTTAAVGWVLVSGLVVCGWLMGDDVGLSAALELGTRLWLLGGGVPVGIGGLDVSLVPCGLTAVTAALLWRFGAYAARRVTPTSSTGPWGVAAVVTLAYALPVLGAAIFLGEPWRAPGRWAAVVLVLLLAARAGSGRALRRPIGSSWPTALTGLPRAAAGAVGVLLLAGTAVLVVGLVTGWGRVTDLSAALRAGSAGTALLVLVQASVLPNALVWSGSYALGAGFSMGSGTVVAPAATSLGVLPGLPLLGALPAVGPGSTLQLWWLVFGAVAGALAAWLALRGGATRRFDASTLVGGLAGVVGALVFTGLAWTTSGDLGTERLTGLGPRLVPLLVMSTTTLGLSGMVTGAVVGVVRHLRREPVDARDAEETGPVEETEVIDQTDQTEETEEIAR
jgi:hypothetical protein